MTPPPDRAKVGARPAGAAGMPPEPVIPAGRPTGAVRLLPRTGAVLLEPVRVVREENLRVLVGGVPPGPEAWP